MLSRKYYRAVAEILRSAELSAPQRDYLVRAFAQWLKGDNERFSERRFMDACLTGHGEKRAPTNSTWLITLFEYADLAESFVKKWGYKDLKQYLKINPRAEKLCREMERVLQARNEPMPPIPR